MIKSILREPNKILRTRSEVVVDFEYQETKQAIKDLIDTLLVTKEGLGLAAPQIGVNLRIFVLNIKGEFKVFINPEITHFSNKKTLFNEGCLSVMKQFDEIQRSSKVVMKYYDEIGKKHKTTVKGLIAQAFQHEIDHLNGILYIDKIKNLK
jgi:peptide deformylase